MTSLPRFFDTMLPFLLGEMGAAEALAQLGPSPSNVTRFAYYQELVRRDRVSVLRLLYPATRVAAERLQPRLFADLVRAHLARYRSTHWEPNRFGEPFPALVEEICASEALQVLPELADYEWLKFVVTIEKGKPINLRGYDHDLVEFAQRASRGCDAELPPRRSVTLAIHRSADDRAATTALGDAELAALARRNGDVTSRAFVSEDDLRTAEERLIARGAL